MDSDSPKLLALPIDDLALCAYADENYAKHRQYWRSFLKMLLPTLLERDPAEIDEIVEHSTLREWKDLVAKNHPSGSVGALMRHISASLSLFIGHPAELGFSAFLDCALPTRMHSLPGLRRHEAPGMPLSPAIQSRAYDVDDIFVDWFSRLALKQNDEAFGLVVAGWQEALHHLPMAHFTSPDSDSEGREAEVDDSAPVSSDGLQSAS